MEKSTGRLRRKKSTNAFEGYSRGLEHSRHFAGRIVTSGGGRSRNSRYTQRLERSRRRARTFWCRARRQRHYVWNLCNSKVASGSAPGNSQMARAWCPASASSTRAMRSPASRCGPSENAAIAQALPCTRRQPGFSFRAGLRGILIDPNMAVTAARHIAFRVLRRVEAEVAFASDLLHAELG